MARPSEVTGREADGDFLPEGHADAPARGSSGAPPVAGGTPKLGWRGWLRFLWRQLTSMRVALILLLLLAVAAIPGSLVPQRGADPNGVTQYFSEHPDLAPVLDSLSLFDVYASPWFSAIYLLLFVSLIGCVVPRIRHHWLAMRSAPPRTPVRLERLAAYRRFDTEAAPEDVLDRARALLRRRHYRVADYERSGQASVSAERGYLRETGNLVFHVALVGVLVAVAVGGGVAYHGQRVIVEGDTFQNALTSYDSFTPGRWFDESELSPFSVTLDGFHAQYADSRTDISLGSYGQATDYRADVTVSRPGQAAQAASVKVNQPLNVDGTDLFLLGNGYAPVITVRNAAGDVVFSDPVAFLPQDTNLTSLGVVKVTDIGDSAHQIGLVGFFYPTESQMSTGALTSVYPDLDNPVLSLDVYEGDLGVDQGVPKSVYELDTDGLTKLAGRGVDGQDSLRMKPGETADLPGGRGTVTFDEVKRFASFDLRHDRSQPWVLGFALLAVLGLLSSLFVPRRRVWVQVTSADGGCSVEVAGLARGDDPTLDDAVRRVAAELGDVGARGTGAADGASSSDGGAPGAPGAGPTRGKER